MSARDPGAVTPDVMGPVTARALYMMGDDVTREWTPQTAVAWEGLLEVARRLRRDAETLLEERHGLGISMLGIMGRLVRAPRETLRQTDLADAMGLSLSRVSRVIDGLEERGLVARERCPSDARATNVRLTQEGRALTAAAQGTTFSFVSRAFAERLSGEEVAGLAATVTRLLTPDPGA